MITAVEGLVGELRRAGLPVSASDHADALAILRFVDLGSRAEVKVALGAVLVKDAGHEPAYSAIFDLYFVAGADWANRPAGALSGAGDHELNELVLAALQAGQAPWLRILAAEVVTRFAGVVPGRSVAGTFYLQRAMRAVEAESLPARLLAASPASVTSGPPGRTVDDLGQMLLAEEYERRVERFRREVEAEIRRQMVTDRGADEVARTLRTPLPEDADFLTASAEQVTRLRAVVVPLARKLAARLAARQRRSRRGPLDFRRTVRASMSSGGVLMDPVFRPARPVRPELVILADISGSVSVFAEFTLHLTYALRAEFTRVRSFVFVDTADEVTQILADAPDIAAATAQINARGCGVWLDGHSDYGNALRTFAERHGDALRARTTVLVLGDGRANYRASGADELSGIARRAGHVFWLNPEPAAMWDSGDSVMGEYAARCDAAFECRNVRQLRAFVEQLLLPGKDDGGRKGHGPRPVRAQVLGLLAY